MDERVRRLVEALIERYDNQDNQDKLGNNIIAVLGEHDGKDYFPDISAALRALLTPRDPERYTATCRSSDRAGSGLEVAHLLRVIAYALEEGEDVVDAIAQQYPTYVDPVRCAQWLCGVADEAEDLVLPMGGSRVIPAEEHARAVEAAYREGIGAGSGSMTDPESRAAAHKWAASKARVGLAVVEGVERG